MKNINLLLPNPLLIYHEKFSPRIAEHKHAVKNNDSTLSPDEAPFSLNLAIVGGGKT